MPCSTWSFEEYLMTQKKQKNVSSTSTHGYTDCKPSLMHSPMWAVPLTQAEINQHSLQQQGKSVDSSATRRSRKKNSKHLGKKYFKYSKTLRHLRRSKSDK